MSRKRKSTESYNYNRTLTDWMGGFGRAAVDGQEIGVEIEVEGTDLPRGNNKGWAIHEDGSLRGESAEYVFNGPASRQDTIERLNAFQARLDKSGAVVNESYRTSVHVHLNAQNLTIKQIFNQILLYTIFEDVMAEIAGKERVGNLFCLRVKDAEFYLQSLHRAILEDNINRLNDTHLRYSAVNVLSLFSHGTLEFRSFRGTTDTKLIQQWINLLLAIKDAASDKFLNPIEIVQAVSTDGPDRFAQRIFTDEQIAGFMGGWQDKVFEGVRLIQHVAYASTWEETPKVKKSAAPTYASYSNFGNLTIAAPDLQEAVRVQREFADQRARGGAVVPAWAQVPVPPQEVEPPPPQWLDAEEEL